MHVGKGTGATRCDHCGTVVVGVPDSVKIGDKLRHFCPEVSCMEQFFLERFRPEIEKLVDRRYREEAEYLFTLICPACKSRFRTLTNMQLKPGQVKT